MTAWTDHIKEFAKRNGLTYGCALSNADCKAEYAAKKCGACSKKADAKKCGDCSKKAAAPVPVSVAPSVKKITIPVPVPKKAAAPVPTPKKEAPADTKMAKVAEYYKNTVGYIYAIFSDYDDLSEENDDLSKAEKKLVKSAVKAVMAKYKTIDAKIVKLIKKKTGEDLHSRDDFYYDSYDLDYADYSNFGLSPIEAIKRYLDTGVREATETMEDGYEQIAKVLN